MKVHWYYAVKEVKRRRLRSLANISGYTLAVSLMIILISMSQASTFSSSEVLRGVGTHFMVFVPAAKSCPCQFLDVGPFIKGVYTETISLSTVDQIQSLPGVKDAAPYFMFKLGNLTIGGIELGSLATETTVVSSEEVMQGRYLQEYADEKAVLLDEIFANMMELKVGDNWEAFEKNFTVVGIVNPNIHSRPGGIADMYTNIEVVEEISESYSHLNYLIGGDANAVLVEATHEGDVKKMEEVTRSVIDTLENEVGREVSLVGYGCYVPARNVVSIAEETAWTISTVIVLSTILLSLRSQWSSMVERRSEIGILKAVGWADSDIVKQLVIESTLQGIAGGLIGCGIGYAISLLLPLLGLIPPGNSMVVPLFASIIGLIASVVGGVVAGALPARQAASLKPAEALRRL